MTFTLTRAVRGGDAAALPLGAKLQSVDRTPAPKRMDLPYAEELLQLDLSDFVKTVPGTLE